MKKAAKSPPKEDSASRVPKPTYPPAVLQRMIIETTLPNGQLLHTERIRFNYRGFILELDLFNDHQDLVVFFERNRNPAEKDDGRPPNNFVIYRLHFVRSYHDVGEKHLRDEHQKLQSQIAAELWRSLLEGEKKTYTEAAKVFKDRKPADYTYHPRSKAQIGADKEAKKAADSLAKERKRQEEEAEALAFGRTVVAYRAELKSKGKLEAAYLKVLAERFGLSVRRFKKWKNSIVGQEAVAAAIEADHAASALPLDNPLLTDCPTPDSSVVLNDIPSLDFSSSDNTYFSDSPDFSPAGDNSFASASGSVSSLDNNAPIDASTMMGSYGQYPAQVKALFELNGLPTDDCAYTDLQMNTFLYQASNSGDLPREEPNVFDDSFGTYQGSMGNSMVDAMFATGQEGGQLGTSGIGSEDAYSMLNGLADMSLPSDSAFQSAEEYINEGSMAVSAQGAYVDVFNCPVVPMTTHASNSKPETLLSLSAPLVSLGAGSTLVGKKRSRDTSDDVPQPSKRARHAALYEEARFPNALQEDGGQVIQEEPYLHWSEEKEEEFMRLMKSLGTNAQEVPMSAFLMTDAMSNNQVGSAQWLASEQAFYGFPSFEDTGLETPVGGSFPAPPTVPCSSGHVGHPQTGRSFS